MPAVSKAQQRMFGYLHAHPEEAKRRGVSARVAEEYASTSRKGLPEHVRKARRSAAARFGRAS